MSITTFRPADFRSRRRQQPSKSRRSPSRGKAAKPLDAERQALVAGMLKDVRALAIAYRRRRAVDVPLDDLVSEAVCALCYAASLFDTSRGVPWPEFAKMVAHHAMKREVIRVRRWRRAGGWPTDDDGVCLDPADRPEPDVANRMDAVGLLDRVRCTLPAKHYDVLRLRYVEGLTLEAIGRRYGCKHQWIAELLTRATLVARASAAQRHESIR